MPETDDVTPFFEAKSKSSATNSTHTSVVPVPVDNGVRYVMIDPPSDGWIDALGAGGRVPLCAYTKVKLLKKDGGRVYFKLLDGRADGVGSEFSMKEAGAIEYLRKTSRKSGIKLEVTNLKINDPVMSVPRSGQKLIQALGELGCGGFFIPVTLSTYEPTGPRGASTPIPVGTYKLWAPDYPHTGEYTTQYRVDTKKGQFDKIWFRIEYNNNSRYVHMGHFSEGCVTVMDINNWEALYNDIIQHRSDGNASDKPGGGKYIGTITVKAHPVQGPREERPLYSY